jgi:hypothetical protein
MQIIQAEVFKLLSPRYLQRGGYFVSERVNAA